MRSRSVPVALAVAVLSASGAVACSLEANQLRTDAGWLFVRGSAEGDQYADTFDDTAADKQLALFEQRRAVLDKAALWQMGQILLVLLSVISTVASYALYLVHKVRASLEQVEAPANAR